MKRSRKTIAQLTSGILLGILLQVVSLSQPIRVSGGNQTLAITTGTANGQPVSVTNSSCTLTYQRQAVLAKITVMTSCPGQRFSLAVVATSVSKGTAAPQVSLLNGNPALDFVTNIAKTGSPTGTCTLLYTASATFSQGNSSELGNDIHSITYTIQAQ